jgi:hypothetical protein
MNDRFQETISRIFQEQGQIGFPVVIQQSRNASERQAVALLLIYVKLLVFLSKNT